MEEIDSYITLDGKPDELQEKVNNWIRSGYQPFGEPTFMERGHPKYTKYMYGVQVMVRKRK